MPDHQHFNIFHRIFEIVTEFYYFMILKLSSMKQGDRIFFFLIFYFMATPMVYRVARPGTESELQLQQCWILEPTVPG